MKCFYTESDVTDSAAPLIICAINETGEARTPEQKRFYHSFSGAIDSVKPFFTPVADEAPPSMGDVIWVQTSPNAARQIGFCVVETSDGDLDIEAFEAALSNVKRKADTMGVGFVGMDVFGCQTSDQWKNNIDLLESTLDNIQPVVCVTTNEALITLLDDLGKTTKLSFEKERVYKFDTNAHK